MPSVIKQPPIAQYQVRTLQRSDIAEVVKLQRQAGALHLLWTAGQLESHLRNHPDGQLVVVDDHGKLVASCSTLRLDIDADMVPGDWRNATGNGYFHTHTADGDTLFIADVSLAQGPERAAIRRALDTALLAMARETGVRRLLTTCRLPGFAAHADRLTPATYLEAIAAGDVTEPVIQALLDQGFRPVALVPDLQNQPRANDKLVTLLEWQAGAA